MDGERAHVQGLDDRCEHDRRSNSSEGHAGYPDAVCWKLTNGLEAETSDALALQRPLADGAIRIVAKGKKEDVLLTMNSSGDSFAAEIGLLRALARSRRFLDHCLAEAAYADVCAETVASLGGVELWIHGGDRGYARRIDLEISTLNGAPLGERERERERERATACHAR